MAWRSFFDTGILRTIDERQWISFGSENKAVRPQWRIAAENVPDKVRGRMNKYRVGFCDVVNPTTEKCLIAIPRLIEVSVEIP
jgi:hypothetical protein